MWCIIWPILIGLICALLGYLLGRLLGKGSGNWEEKIASLEADLEACRKKRLALETDLEACNKSKLSLESKGDDSITLKSQIAKLEADLVASNNSNLGLKAQGDDVNIWKDKVSKLEADLSACNKSKSEYDSELNIWKNKVSNLKVDLEACRASKPVVEVSNFDADAAKAVFGKKIKQDDLKVVEGIGPKIEGLFHSFNIKTWKALSEASVEECQEVLNSGGERYKIHNPGTWPKQSQLAYEGKWAELLKWQDELDGGKA